MKIISTAVKGAMAIMYLLSLTDHAFILKTANTHIHKQTEKWQEICT